MHGVFPPQRYFAYKTWQEIADFPDKSNTVIVQPLGAIEQHGWHLPLAVDALICIEVVGRSLAQLEPEIPALVLPPLYYGKSNEHLSFAGTISLSTGLMLKLLEEIGANIYRSGFRKLALVNAHGGQPQILELVARDLHAKYPDFWVFPLFIWRAPNACSELLSPRELADGIHAGAGETSVLLEIESKLGWGLVHMDKAVCAYPPELVGSMLSLEGAHPYSWVTQDISASGVIGDATIANREMGKQIMDTLVAGWVQLWRDIYHFRRPCPRS
jgi:creatinine amidohydrolase